MQSYTNVWASGIIPFMLFDSRPVLLKSNREFMSPHVRAAKQIRRNWEGLHRAFNLNSEMGSVPKYNVLRIIIIIICYNFHTWYVQLYTYNKPCSQLYCGHTIWHI
jgi:hypothetical protein